MNPQDSKKPRPDAAKDNKPRPALTIEIEELPASDLDGVAGGGSDSMEPTSGSGGSRTLTDAERVRA